MSTEPGEVHERCFGYGDNSPRVLGLSGGFKRSLLDTKFSFCDEEKAIERMQEFAGRGVNLVWAIVRMGGHRSALCGLT
jgi:hypothetical protein